MEQRLKYIEDNKDRFIEELFGLLRIPSVSSKAGHREDMHRAAGYLKESILAAGAESAEIISTDGHPVVYAEKIIDPTMPVVMVYGHYDVQPADPFELWKSPPFEPEIREGKIWGRGADDNKGQLYMHIKAFEYMVKTRSLPCNVKFMIEGEEEIGSPSMGKFCQENAGKLGCDVILVSDTSMIAENVPSITTGLRGLSYVEVEVTGPGRDLHSGVYGGAVANPANVLAKMIASLTDEDNRITIPGFYDDVLEVNPEEREEMAGAPFNADKYKKEIEVDELSGEAGYSTNERTGIRPSLDVNGIWGGYTGEGAKTILPSTAHAKISMRLVPDQQSKKIGELFINHFKAIAPPGVRVSARVLHGGEGYVSPVDHPGYRAASKACEDTFGRRPVPFRSGGSIPIISLFEKILNAKSILLGFGLESDAIHSPNENFPLWNFYKGIETIPLFYSYYVQELQ